jgi:hypothetical protein
MNSSVITGMIQPVVRRVASSSSTMKTTPTMTSSGRRGGAVGEIVAAPMRVDDGRDRKRCRARRPTSGCGCGTASPAETAGSSAPARRRRGVALITTAMVVEIRPGQPIRRLAAPSSASTRLSASSETASRPASSRAILAAAGMSYKDMGKVEYLPFAESVDLMKNRQLNATLQSAGLGVASLKDL